MSGRLAEHYVVCQVRICEHLPHASTGCGGCKERFYLTEANVILWKGAHWHALCAFNELIEELGRV